MSARHDVDETWFRTNVPARVGLFEILRVGRVRQGREGEYPGAIVVSRYGNEFAVHMLLYRDDQIQEPWLLWDGDYVPDRETAEAIARKRESR